MNNRKGGKINWTLEMLEQLKQEFPTRYNRELATELGVSFRSLIRKARELGYEKEPGFLDKRRDEITRMAMETHPPHPMKGVKGWCVPNSQKTRFQPGNISAMSIDRNVVRKCHAKRNATIDKELHRIKNNLPRKTKLNLSKNHYMIKENEAAKSHRQRMKESAEKIEMLKPNDTSKRKYKVVIGSAVHFTDDEGRYKDLMNKKAALANDPLFQLKHQKY